KNLDIVHPVEGDILPDCTNSISNASNWYSNLPMSLSRHRLSADIPSPLDILAQTAIASLLFQYFSRDTYSPTTSAQRIKRYANSSETLSPFHVCLASDTTASHLLTISSPNLDTMFTASSKYTLASSEAVFNTARASPIYLSAISSGPSSVILFIRL